MCDELKLPKNMIKYDNEKELKNEIINVMNCLDKINEGINILSNRGISKEQIEEILKNKLIKLKGNNLYNIETKIDTDQDTNKIYQNMYNALYNYLYIKEFDHYQINQPINYKDNSFLYLINVYYRLYQQIINIKYDDKDNIYVNIDENKLKKYSKLKNFQN